MNKQMSRNFIFCICKELHMLNSKNSYCSISPQGKRLSSKILLTGTRREQVAHAEIKKQPDPADLCYCEMKK
jgi:hypothetical protein